MMICVNGFVSGVVMVFVVFVFVVCSLLFVWFYMFSLVDVVVLLCIVLVNLVFLIEVLLVGVFEQVVKSQLVVQKNVVQVDVFEQECWVLLFVDEICCVLLDDFVVQFGMIDVVNFVYLFGVFVYCISVNVQCFELWLGKCVVVDVVWSVCLFVMQVVMICCMSVVELVVDGYDVFVVGYWCVFDVIVL